ncbi:MAG: hypothetical protein M3O35_20935 [Acidobacteriota bacterium]|nr:hypothetical protein [Acidobacteriota bacterium]
MISVVKKFMGHVVPGVARPLAILWNQVIGFFFLALAVIPAPSTISRIRAGGVSPGVVLSLVFMAIMGGFGISSFWRARRISRS